MKIVKIFLALFILSLPLGQIFRFEISETVAIVPQDFIASTLLFFWFWYTFGIKKKFVLPPGFGIIFAFIFALFVSMFSSFRLFETGEVIIGSLFFIRFIVYLGIYFVVVTSIQKSEIFSWARLVFVSGLIFVLAGFLQLILIPDLRFLTIHGWDPHIGRIVSTLLDPNFSGFVFLMTFVLGLGLYQVNKTPTFFIGSILSLLALFLTFSRSSYLAILAAILVFGFLRSKPLIIFSIAFFLLFLIFIPRASERILGVLVLDETARARILSWERGLEIFKEDPLFGIGFGNYRFAQKEFGFFSPQEPLGGHSGAGSDSSFVTILATGGLLSFLVFASLLIFIAKSLIRTREKIFSVISLAIFLALIIHSQFVNSFLFPTILVIFLMILGFSQIESEKEDV